VKTSEILKIVDHTLLNQVTTTEEIKKLCDEGMNYNVASVCIPSSYVKYAKEYTKGNLPICTVIGFPNGYSTTDTKVFETKSCIDNGADEIDMVINIGMVKNKEFDLIEKEINEIKKVAKNNILKVIIETCLLTDEEKIKMCSVVSNSGAEYIKTSTGFSTSGATFEDIQLFKKHVLSHVKIKAAGGIKTIDDAIKFIELGADRLGTSRIVKLANDEDASGY